MHDADRPAPPPNAPDGARLVLCDLDGCVAVLPKRLLQLLLQFLLGGGRRSRRRRRSRGRRRSHRRHRDWRDCACVGVGSWLAWVGWGGGEVVGSVFTHAHGKSMGVALLSPLVLVLAPRATHVPPEFPRVLHPRRPMPCVCVLSVELQCYARQAGIAGLVGLHPPCTSNGLMWLSEAPAPTTDNRQPTRAN